MNKIDFTKPEIQAKCVASIINFILIIAGICGIYFAINHYHATWKEIILIILSVNLIEGIGSFYPMWKDIIKR